MRRNRLSDFRNLRASGLIAMKLDENDHLIGVATCRDGDDALLATRRGRCLRFQITDDQVRVFAGRESSGVRGIKLGGDDRVISLSILRHVEASVAERTAYLRLAAARRRTGEDETEVEADTSEPEESVEETALTAERVAELEAAEDILLVVTDRGFGKRSSAYDYRVTGRGGQGIANLMLSARTGTEVVATLPVLPNSDVMLVTDGGRLIRVPVDQVRISARQTMGVTLLRLNADERVGSVFPVLEDDTDETSDGAAVAPDGHPVGQPDGESDGYPGEEPV